MARKKGVRTYDQGVVNRIIVCLILVLIVYMAVQLFSPFSEQLSTQKTQYVTEKVQSSYTGYVFRREEVILDKNSGVVNYLVSDGERVGVGQSYADFYSAQTLGGEQIGSKQAELDLVLSQLEILEQSEVVSGGVSDLAHLDREIEKPYYAYLNSLDNGDFKAADIWAQRLLSSLVKYSAATGDKGQSIKSRLEAEREKILSSLNTEPNHYVSNDSFNFYYDTDGYEEIFNSDALKSLDTKGLEGLIDQSPKEYGERLVGKKMLSQNWYLAISADEATYLAYREGGIYTVSFFDGENTDVNMTLEEIRIDEGNEGSALMIFMSRDMNVGARLSRAQNVKILTDSYSGYRIPKEAKREVDGEVGVYILFGNTVEFRRVTVLLECDGYYIVDTYESDLDEGSKSKIPYLALNDLIIINGNDLYDNKQLN